MHIDMKVEINVTNQMRKKNFDEHAKMLDLHDTTLKNIEVQLGQLNQVVQARKQATFQNDKGSSSKGKEQCLAVMVKSNEKGTTLKEASGSKEDGE